MRKNLIMIGAGMMLALASCDKTEIREITEDRVVPQPVDTIKVADHFYLDGHLSRTAEDLGGRPLDAANLFHDGKELYVANFAGKCVDVFDVETLEFKRSMSNGDRTLARDVYAEGDHLFGCRRKSGGTDLRQENGQISQPPGHRFLASQHGF